MDSNHLAEQLINFACVHYNGKDDASAYMAANQILATYPELAKFDFYTAIVCLNAPYVAQLLKEDPALATTAGGPMHCAPILYATYSRIHDQSDHKNAVKILKMLLEHGADANSFTLLNDQYRFTALTGVAGEGEGGVQAQPPHQYAREMATVLLDAGANANDGQALYNTIFSNNSLEWTKLFIKYGLTAKHNINWDQTKDSQSCFDFLLAYAVEHGLTDRVKFLLAQGADANTTNQYTNRLVYQSAFVCGHAEIANLLLQHGANKIKFSVEDKFRQALATKDIGKINALLDKNDHLTSLTDLLHHATHHATFDIVKRLINRGFPVDAPNENNGQTVLHHYAWNNDEQAVETLIQLGADTTIEDKHYASNALGFALYNQAMKVVNLLGSLTTDIIEATWCANDNQVKKLLKANPELINQRTTRGNTLIHIIGFPLGEAADRQACENILAQFIDHGLSLTTLNSEGQTPLQFAEAMGNVALHQLLASHSE